MKPVKTAEDLRQPASKSLQKPARTSAPPSEREFLPAALEIIESPPSPLGSALVWLICIVFTGVLAWSYFGWLDIHAIAHGRVQPSGRSKVVQSMDAGRVAAIRVENGSAVKAGDIVIELNSTESTADQQANERDLAAAEAEIVRRKAAIEAAQLSAIVPPVELPLSDRIPEIVRERERKVLLADLEQLAANLNALSSQISEREATRERLALSMGARKELIQFLQERVDARKSLDRKGLGYRGKVIDALQDLGREKTSLASEIGQLAEADAGVRSLQSKFAQVRSDFVADNSQKLSNSERRRDRLVQEVVKSRTKADRMWLRAPIDGTAQQLAVTTIGQVVASGQPLMTIVPADSPIEISALVRNQDIGFVESGQDAVVKIEAFPFTRYGTIEAKVLKVSREAVEETSAASLNDPVEATRPHGASPAPGKSLVYPATLALARRAILVDGREVALAPGMTVTVEIKTGARRAIDYLLSPLREVQSGSGHER